MEEEQNEHIAVFFDAENVSATHVPAILKAVQGFGDVSIRRAYADWSLPSAKSWNKVLSSQPIMPIQQFHNKEKQAVDKAIMMDCVQIASEHKEIGMFCLVTSDHGFSTLVLKLREMGRKVIGFGEKAKSGDNSLLVNACNEYCYVEDLKTVVEDIIPLTEGTAKEEASDSLTTDMANFSLSKFLEQAYDVTPKEQHGGVLLSRMGESLRLFKSDFTCKAYGYPNLRIMIESFPSEYKLSSDGKETPTYTVHKIDYTEIGKKLDGTIKRIINHYGIIHNDTYGDFFFYMGDIKPEFHDRKVRKESKVSFTATKMPNPKAENSLERNGKAEEIGLLDE